MALLTYANLKDAVARWVGGSDNQSAGSLGITSTIDDLITIAESKIFRDVRSKDTEQSFSTSISNGVVALPTDYIDLKFSYIDGTPTQTLERRTPEWIYSNYGARTASSKPKAISREASNWIFGPYPDSGYTVKGVYYKRLVAVATTPNALYLNNPDLYLFGALSEAILLIGPDKRIPLWKQKYDETMQMVNLADKREGSSGSSLQMRPG